MVFFTDEKNNRLLFSKQKDGLRELLETKIDDGGTFEKTAVLYNEEDAFFLDFQKK